VTRFGTCSQGFTGETGSELDRPQWSVGCSEVPTGSPDGLGGGCTRALAGGRLVTTNGVTRRPQPRRVFFRSSQATADPEPFTALVPPPLAVALFRRVLKKVAGVVDRVSPSSWCSFQVREFL